MNRILFLLAALFLCWSISSCKFYHRISGRSKRVADSSLVLVTDTTRQQMDTGAVVQVDTSGTIPPATADSTQLALLAMLTPYWNAHIPWITFNGRAKVHFDGKGENQDFTATIRMEKGKRVWMSVVALGVVEAARVLITPDSIQILDKLHKEARLMPFNEAGALLPVKADFAALQSLIIGEVLQTGKEPNSAQDTAGEWLLSYLSPELSQTLQLIKQDTSLHFQAVSSDGSFLLCEYSNYSMLGTRRFASNRNLFMDDKTERYNISLEFNKAEFDQPVEMPFSIPDKYQRR